MIPSTLLSSVQGRSNRTTQQRKRRRLWRKHEALAGASKNIQGRIKHLAPLFKELLLTVKTRQGASLVFMPRVLQKYVKKEVFTQFPFLLYACNTTKSAWPQLRENRKTVSALATAATYMDAYEDYALSGDTQCPTKNLRWPEIRSSCG